MHKMNNKEISVALSLFIVVAGVAGIFLISNPGITGFSVFDISKVGGLGIGFAFLIFFIISMIVALANLVYQESK